MSRFKRWAARGAAAVTVAAGLSAGATAIAGTAAWAWSGTLTGSGHCSMQQGIVDWYLTVTDADANYTVTATGGHAVSGNTGGSADHKTASGRFNEGLLLGRPQVTVLHASESWADGEHAGPQTFTVTIPPRGKACSQPPETTTTVATTTTTRPPATTTTSTTAPATTTTVADTTTTEATTVPPDTSTIPVPPPRSTTTLFVQTPPPPPPPLATTTTAPSTTTTTAALVSTPTTFPVGQTGNTPLAFTGSNTGPEIGVGAAAVLSGGAVVYAIRRRRRR